MLKCLTFFFLISLSFPCQGYVVLKNIMSPDIKAYVKKSPVGDKTNTDIFEFIIKEIDKNKNATREEALKFSQMEKNALRSNGQLKPESVSISESIFSHLLRALCKLNSGCVALAVYAKNGLAIGLTDMLPAVLLKEHNWKSLQKKFLKVEPIITVPSCKEAVNLGLLCTNNYVSVTYRVYRASNGSTFISGKRNTNDTVIGFVRCVMDLNEINQMIKKSR